MQDLLIGRVALRRVDPRQPKSGAPDSFQTPVSFASETMYERCDGMVTQSGKGRESFKTSDASYRS